MDPKFENSDDWWVTAYIFEDQDTLTFRAVGLKKVVVGVDGWRVSKKFLEGNLDNKER